MGRDRSAGILIGGEWLSATDDSKFDVFDPATGDRIATLADASVDDGLAALDSAERAQDEWLRTSPNLRAGILREAQARLLADRERIAALISLESGKRIDEAEAEVEYGASFLGWFADEAPRLAGLQLPAPGGRGRFVTSKVPVGISLLVTPWNFPLAMITRKLAPALAAGCTALVKPPPQTPLTAIAFAGILTECGLPAGVVNVLPTTRAGELTRPLLADGRVRKISFTGSSAVGRILLRQAADRVLRTSMELGGNAPLIVFEDADMDLAIEGAMVAKMRNGGQSCVAANRIYVAGPVFDEFTERFSEMMSKLVIGPGSDRDSGVGPLIDSSSRDKVAGLVGDAVSGGATVVTGGEIVDGPGHFFEPTVLVGVQPGSRMLDEEIFGPVAQIAPFSDEQSALAMANSTPYGLAAYIFTENLSRTQRMIDGLDVGMVGVNSGMVSNAAAPFGGVKESGLGREGGFQGIEEYLETKYAFLPS